MPVIAEIYKIKSLLMLLELVGAFLISHNNNNNKKKTKKSVFHFYLYSDIFLCHLYLVFSRLEVSAQVAFLGVTFRYLLMGVFLYLKPHSPTHSLA